MTNQTMVDQLKTILREFNVEIENLDNEALNLLQMGSVALTDKCDRELFYRGQIQYWTHDGVTRILQPCDDFTKVGGAQVVPIERQIHV